MVRLCSRGSAVIVHRRRPYTRFGYGGVDRELHHWTSCTREETLVQMRMHILLFVPCAVRVSGLELPMLGTADISDNSQAVVSLSSAEAEFYAAVKAAAAGIGCVSMISGLGVILQQQGVEVKAKGLGNGIDSPSLEIKLDATAGRAIAMRRGAGRVRHIATPTLRMQRPVS